MQKKTKIFYCFIKHEFLEKVYDKDIIIKAKYKIRPFVYFGDLGIALAIPEVTNHKTKKYDDNFYFDNDNHYLDVGSMIYVNKENIILSKWMNSDPQLIKLLNKIEMDIPSIIDKAIYIEFKMSKSTKYMKNHIQIKKSKKIMKKWLNNKKTI